MVLLSTWESPPHTRKDFIRLEGSTIPIIGNHFYRAPDGLLLKVGGSEGEAQMTVLARYVLEDTLTVLRVHAFIQIPPNISAILLDYVQGIPLSALWNDLSATQRTTIKNQLCDALLAMRRPSFEYAGRPGRKPYVLPKELGFSAHDFCSNVEEWNGSRERAIVATWLVKTDRFVLTHGDLSDRNILVDLNTLTIVSLLDWEYANVVPTYFEYVAARLSGGHRSYWRAEPLEVLEKVLERECGEMMTNVEAELARWKALVDVERYAQGMDDDCTWTFEQEISSCE
ncbi:uncharacterized protein LAESUDRAFT_738383 [Laetiporus sulphureus 93-53]|uniref:Aminoglycoside phosphotransferase domain-containing protein n=1 Tax=Laetiporus sulphureus 93-53 TaxID=1314785 RepID=A0A165CPS3_9APHY|nr:uncharacterized protein LAESUDRAFT_738383 [Laetiporus sulphureus 93-53]KZT03197.1 hypothetical protein LAESUDRAFT_738383 [Laetiporus sulphureus 93-53]